MVKVSKSYNPYSTVRNIDMLVTFDAVNTNAASKTTFTSNNYSYISNLSQITNGNTDTKKYASCENNLVMLDGTWEYLNDNILNEEIGWWSESVSDENGEFIDTPTLTGKLSTNENCVGFTIYSNSTNCIQEAIVTVYNGTNIIYSEVFYCDTVDNKKIIVDLPANDFNKITVQVTKSTEPYRRIKLNELNFGIEKKWDKNSIVSAKINESCDICGDALPIKKASIVFSNEDGDFNITGTNKKYVYRNAMSKANITSNDVNIISKYSQLSDNIITQLKYATSENSYTLLDGSYTYLPDIIPNNYQIAYLSNNISDANGHFDISPSLTYSWNNNFDFSGFRFFFEENSYPKTIDIYAYENNTVINSINITDNSEYNLTVDLPVSSCNKIVFKFNDLTNGNRYLKISEIQILRYSDSWINYLTTDYPLSIYFVVNGEKIHMGSNYYFESIKPTNGGLTAEITAHDYIYNLDNQTYTGGSNTSTYTSTVAYKILANTGITASLIGQPFHLIMNTTPKDTTKRAALHYISQATEKTCWLTRDNKLKIKELSVDDVKDNFNKTNLYSMDILNLSDYVNMVRLTVKNEYVDPQTETIYFGGSGLYYREMNNNCVYGNFGVQVAEWLLKQKQRRISFNMTCRGNPALEIGDTIKIVDKNGTSYLAVIYDQKFEYNGGLKATVKAIV